MRILCLVLFGLIVGACQVKNHENFSDFKTEGFLNKDYYQFLVENQPDKNSRGLVESRESAFFAARNRIEEALSLTLSQYCLKNAVAKALVSEKEELYKSLLQSLPLKMRYYYQYSYIAEEYYKEDYGIILVCRIHKSGLKDEIDSISLK